MCYYLKESLSCSVVFLSGCAFGAGFLVNYNDVAGPYAGIAFGIGNTFGTAPGIVAPYLVGIITKNVIFSLKFFSKYIYLRRNNST
jgi:hypothetical protein